MINTCRELNDNRAWYDNINRTIYLREYEKVTIFDDNNDVYELLRAFPGQSNLIESEEIIVDDKRCLRFSAGCKVGIEKVGDSTAVVYPKIDNADFLTMVNYAYDFNIDFDKEKVYLDYQQKNLTAIFLKFIILRLQEFIAKELKRSFIKREESLSSKVKGKVMLSSYLKNSIPSRKDSIIPCQFHEIQIDCLENQIIRYAVEIARIVIPAVVYSHQLRKEMMSICSRLLQKMGMVSFKRIELSDFNRIRYVGRFKDYKHIHELCKLFLQATKMEMRSGRLAFKGFIMDMNDLFEKFIAGVIGKEAGLSVEMQKHGLFSVNGFKKSIRLDGWLAGRQVVFDTKYKEVFEVDEDSDALKIGNLRVLNSDIYQVLAYCNHHSFIGSTGILIYPLSFFDLTGKNSYLVEGFNRKIYLTGINLNFKGASGKPQEIIDFANTFKEIIEIDLE